MSTNPGRAKLPRTIVSLALLALSVLLSSFHLSSWADSDTPLKNCERKPPQATANTGLTVDYLLSQTKLLQHGDGRVVMEVKVKTPGIKSTHGQRNSTDFVIVLDNSGSMASDSKLPFAKAAINDLISLLHIEDRLGLVTFSSQARIAVELQAADATQRARLRDLVQGIRPEGGTNIGAGLELARSMLQGNLSSRTRKIILLSDGEANEGITSPAGLGQLVQGFSHSGGILSSIGMGLGFNETLMASLADYGMGRFSYLEALSGLEIILARELNEARAVFANVSSIELDLPPTVRLIDASGYPMESLCCQANSLRITTGQLLADREKSLFLTFIAPTAELGQVSLGRPRLKYEFHGQNIEQAFVGEPITIAVMSQVHREEVFASINQKVFTADWTQNSLGQVQKKVAEAIRERRPEEAKRLMNEFRADARRATAHDGKMQAKVMADLSGKIETMENRLTDAFTGSDAEQELKQKRYSKGSFSESIQSQRSE